MPGAVTPVSVPHAGEHLVLYDGLCGLCNRLNMFLLARDSREVFDFASLQSGTGRSLLRRLDGNPTGLDTFYVVTSYRSGSPGLLSKGAAGLFLMRELGLPWSALGLAGALPAGLLNAAYDSVARSRYRFFGRYERCPLPEARHRRRFIDLWSGGIGDNEPVRCLIPLVLLLAFGCGGSGPTSPSGEGARAFYVSTSGNDSNGGSVGSPWQTLRRAMGELRAGDTLYIRQGTYTQSLFEVDFGGTGTSWSSPITVAAYRGEAVTLQVEPGGDNVVRFQNGAVSYVVIDGLAIDGTGGGDISTVVYLGPASHHVRFKNVEIKNSQGNGMLAGGDFHEFLNLNVHDNGQWPGYSESNGMYMFTNNSVIDGGEFHDNEAFGVRFFNSDLTQFSSNNIVRKAQIYRNGHGIGLNGFSVTGSGGGGIVLADVGNVAEDNVVYSNYEGILVFGAKGSSGIKIRNNTVRNNFGLGIEIQAGAANTDVRNNNVYSNGIGIVDLGVASILSNNGPQ